MDGMTNEHIMRHWCYRRQPCTKLHFLQSPVSHLSIY